MPWDLDACEDRGLVGTIHFLNLHCSDEIREQRLRARPAERNSASEDFINEHKRFGQWLVDNASIRYDPPMITVDTSDKSVEEVGQEIKLWVLSRIEGKVRGEVVCDSSPA